MSGTKVAVAQPHTFQSGALSFMSCTSGRESSPLEENDSHHTTEFKTETKKKRFHPLRNLRRMFRRKTRRSSISADSYQPGIPENPEIPAVNLEQRSCSTSKLQEENLAQNFIKNSRLNPGLSLSHDSIFTPDRADSGLSSSDLENSSLSITVLTTPSKECPIKSQSSCSETSLLSIGSSEVELSPSRSGTILDLDLGVTIHELSHNAAKHKMAVKPRRNHGAPRSRRRAVTPKSPLPATPEVSEEGTTGINSSLIKSHPEEPFQLSFECDKLISQTKVKQRTAEFSSNDQEEKFPNEVPKTEDELDVVNQKAESFFGRFLSRRSEKKKKLHLETNSEESEEKPLSHFAKKFSKSSETKTGTGKTPNRRQRVDPVEIPPKKESGNLGCKEKEYFSERKMSSSLSPPKNIWSNQMTSRSISPPKVVWPENYSFCTKLGEPNLIVAGKVHAADVLSSKPNENLLKDFKNPDFVKELTDSVSLFAKDETERRKESEIKEETSGNIKRQHSEDDTPRKKPTSADDSGLKKEWNLSELIVSAKSSESERGNLDVSPQKESCCINVKTFNSYPVSYEAIHEGYENIQIIELVKKEIANPTEAPKVNADNKADAIPEFQKETTGIGKKDNEEEKVETKEKASEAIKRVKPLVSEKPKDLKKSGFPEFKKLILTKVEPNFSEEIEEKPDKVIPKVKATLVERRKSELFLLSEGEEKDWKIKIKPLKKQNSFSELENKNCPESLTSSPPDENIMEKTELPEEEVIEEVVLRKKSVVNESDEQPELMKVFARRSLKVREGEKILEDMQRSRDSDKENEILDSPKEDRKKVACPVEDEKKEQDNLISKEKENQITSKDQTTNEVKIRVTSLTPEVTSRKYVFPAYGRSLSENASKLKESKFLKKEIPILEENKLNKIKNVTGATVSCHTRIGENVEEGDEDTGFKRIQQRKAEWERRAQQGAK